MAGILGMVEELQQRLDLAAIPSVGDRLYPVTAATRAIDLQGMKQAVLPSQIVVHGSMAEDLVAAIRAYAATDANRRNARGLIKQSTLAYAQRTADRLSMEYADKRTRGTVLVEIGYRSPWADSSEAGEDAESTTGHDTRRGSGHGGSTSDFEVTDAVVDLF